MHTIENEYTGELRTTSVHLKSGNTIITDAPTDNNGKGEAFSPTDLIASSLCSCMLTIMGIKARDHEFSIDGAKALVTKVMVSEPRRIAGIRVEIHMPDQSYTDKQKTILERAAKTCPVALSLHPDLTQEFQIVYPHGG